MTETYKVAKGAWQGRMLVLCRQALLLLYRVVLARWPAQVNSGTLPGRQAGRQGHVAAW